MIESPTTLEDPSLKAAIDALRQLQQGQDLGVLRPIEQAMRVSHADTPKREQVEAALEAVLNADVSRRAKDYACRALSRIGSERSVETLAGLLADPGLSHMARYALQRIPHEAAGAALRDAMSTSETMLLIGGINSLGARRDAASVPNLVRLLDSTKPPVVEAAIAALGEIGTRKAAAALRAFHDRVPDDLRLTLGDALLVCAERFVAKGRTKQAMEIYALLDTEKEPAHVRCAAAQGRAGAS